MARDPSHFDDAYAAGVPPWDIGRAQPRFAKLLAAGPLQGPVLDVGCGTGENTIAVAATGVEALGVDLAPLAIERARDKALQRGSSAKFERADALDLSALGRTFATVIDCAVFHVFDDPDRARYIASLAAVTRTGGRYYVLVFSDREPTEWGGPRRVSAGELEAAFASGWKLHTLEATKFDTNIHEHGGEALFAEFERL